MWPAGHGGGVVVLWLILHNDYKIGLIFVLAPGLGYK